MQETVLSIQKLSKNYGRIRAVDNLSLEVQEGNVFGILGPNGSGKTTTLGIVLSVINKNGGNFSWFGGFYSFNKVWLGMILDNISVCSGKAL